MSALSGCRKENWIITQDGWEAASRTPLGGQVRFLEKQLGLVLPVQCSPFQIKLLKLLMRQHLGILLAVVVVFLPLHSLWVLFGGTKVNKCHWEVQPVLCF